MATRKPKGKQPEATPVRMTHGVRSISNNPNDRVQSREITATLGDDGNYYIIIHTVFEDGKQPAHTNISLTPPVYALLLNAMWELHVNRDRWACVPEV